MSFLIGWGIRMQSGAGHGAWNCIQYVRRKNKSSARAARQPPVFGGKAGARVDRAGVLCYNIIMRVYARPHAGGIKQRQDKRILR